MLKLLKIMITLHTCLPIYVFVDLYRYVNIKRTATITMATSNNKIVNYVPYDVQNVRGKE